MAATVFKFANLEEKDLQKVTILEEQMDTTILVMETHHPLAQLSDEQTQKIQALEQELGVYLLAYRK